LPAGPASARHRSGSTAIRRLRRPPQRECSGRGRRAARRRIRRYIVNFSNGRRPTPTSVVDGSSPFKLLSRKRILHLQRIGGRLRRRRRSSLISPPCHLPSCAPSVFGEAAAEVGTERAGFPHRARPLLDGQRSPRRKVVTPAAADRSLRRPKRGSTAPATLDRCSSATYPAEHGD
jgi:hypothetical protein